MNTPLNLGVIGCGRVTERFYLPVLSRTTEARLIAVTDPSRERRELVSARVLGCQAFNSAEELFEKAKIEAVIINTPPATHVAMATLALRSDIPVFVEKPLAPSFAGIEELEALVASSRVSFMVGFNRRYWEPVCQLRQIICNQSRSITPSAQLVMITDMLSWSPISGVSDDPLGDLGSHQFDILRYIFDREILAISAQWTETHAIRMRVRLEGDLVADCLVAYGNIYQESIAIQCARQKYRIYIDSERIQPAAGPIRSVLDLADTARRHVLGQQSLLHRSYERQLLCFFNSVRTGAIPQPGIADGVAAIRVVKAARWSASNDGKEALI